MDSAFIKNLLHLSLTQKLDLMLAESYRDYHVKGFNSIILSRSQNLTLRLYVCKPGETHLNPHNDNILVHNHSFDFQTQILIGAMENAIYQPLPNQSASECPDLDLEPIERWYRYRYDSALSNAEHTMRLTLLDTVPLKCATVDLIKAGSSYCLRHHQFHRIFVPADRLVAMLFWQHQKVPQTPIIFSKIPQPEIYPTTGLYNRFNHGDELRDLVHLVIENL